MPGDNLGFRNTSDSSLGPHRCCIWSPTPFTTTPSSHIHRAERSVSSVTTPAGTGPRHREATGQRSSRAGPGAAKPPSARPGGPFLCPGNAAPGPPSGADGAHPSRGAPVGVRAAKEPPGRGTGGRDGAATPGAERGCGQRRGRPARPYHGGSAGLRWAVATAAPPGPVRSPSQTGRGPSTSAVA